MASISWQSETKNYEIPLLTLRNLRSIPTVAQLTRLIVRMRLLLITVLSSAHLLVVCIVFLIASTLVIDISLFLSPFYIFRFAMFGSLSRLSIIMTPIA